MAKLTEKQIGFLKKHNLWNVGKDKSALGMFEEGNFQDFFKRKEKIEAELARLPDEKIKKDLLQKLNAAEEKAKNKKFKEAYNDLKQVKKDARREANGYVDSLALNDVQDALDELKIGGRKLDQLLQQYESGQSQLRDQLRKEAKAADFKTMSEAAEFLRDFSPTEVTLRSQVTAVKVIADQITTLLDKTKVNEALDAHQHELKMLAKEKNADIGQLGGEISFVYAMYSRKGKLLKSGDLRAEFKKFESDIDKEIKLHKDLSKFQSREADTKGGKISPDTLGRNPTDWKDTPQELDKLLRELAKGNPKSQFDTLIFELKDIEIALAEEKVKNPKALNKDLLERKAKAERAFAMLQKRDEQRFADAQLDFTLDSIGDEGTMKKTQEQKAQAQPIKTFSVSDLTDDITIPANLKKLKAKDIQPIRQEVKTKMEAIIANELKKADSDVVFDLGLKTKEDFVRQLAKELQIDLKNPKCSKEEKLLLDEMADQMVATVKEKFPNKAGKEKFSFTNKFDEKSDAPTEFTLGGRKYVNPKYLSSGGLGDVLRYEEEGSDPKKYTVLKSLKKADKRKEMVHELKVHRQAKGGEQGNNSPNVVGMKGAVQGPDDGLFMALEFEEGGDLKDLGTGMAQAMSTGAISEEARQVLTQHLLRQAIDGMKQVQDSNMTHHDIKGQNFLVSGDGKVKVADFGSAQVADDKGEVRSKGFEYTPGFEAPELLKQKKITGKADTYTLGVLLNNLASPIQGEDNMASSFKSQWEFESKQAVTALDKLKNAMLDKDPTKRPTLEAVMQTAYMTDSTKNYEPEKIENLLKATMDYNKHVAGKTRDDMELILTVEGRIAEKIKKRQGAKPDDLKKLDQEIETLRGEVKQLRAKMQQVLDQKELKPYVDALNKANKELTGHGAEAEQLDVSKLKFKDEYDKIAKTYGLTPTNKLVQTLVQALIAVDQANDLPAKKKLAATAKAEAEKIARQMTEIAKSAPNEKTKMQASQLGVDFRKLDQALKQFIEKP